MTDLVLARTPWGRFYCWPDDLIGRTLIGCCALWVKTGAPFWDAHMKPTVGSGEVDCPHGKFWDGDLLLEHFDAVPSESSVIDIGAYIGLSAVYLAQRCKRVHLVEPEPVAFQTAYRNAGLNPNADRITMHSIAAYDREGLLYATRYDQSNRGGTAYMPPPVAHSIDERPCGVLDTVITPAWPISLIKSDAQGCDLRALRGCRRLITKYQPKIIFEYEPELAALHGDTWADYEEFIYHTGYVMSESKINPSNFIATPE